MLRVVNDIQNLGYRIQKLEFRCYVIYAETAVPVKSVF